MRVSGFPKRLIDLEGATQVIDWLGRASLVYGLSKPLLKRLLRSLRRTPELGFWNGDIRALALLTTLNGNPAIVRDTENIECLACFSKAPKGAFCLFEDEETEEIIPMCPRCCRELVLARKRGVEFMTHAEQEVWQLMRFSPMAGEDFFNKAIDHLNQQKYSHREIRKKFLRRVNFPIDSITYYESD